MTQEYSLSEAREKLKTDNKTLGRWMTLAGIEPRDDPSNQSRKLLSRQQLEHLAHLHGRILPPDTPAKPADPLSALEARLKRHIDQQIAALRSELMDKMDTPEPRTSQMPAVRPAIQPSNPAPRPAASVTTARNTPISTGRQKHNAIREKLIEHGASRDALLWNDMPPELGAALAFAKQQKGQPITACGDDGCPCHALLG